MPIALSHNAKVSTSGGNSIVPHELVVGYWQASWQTGQAMTFELSPGTLSYTLIIVDEQNLPVGCHLNWRRTPGRQIHVCKYTFPIPINMVLPLYGCTQTIRHIRRECLRRARTDARRPRRSKPPSNMASTRTGCQIHACDQTPQFYACTSERLQPATNHLATDLLAAAAEDIRLTMAWDIGTDPKHGNNIPQHSSRARPRETYG